MYPQQPMAYPAQPAYPPQQPQYAPPMPYAPQGQPYGAPVYPAQQQYAPPPPPAPAGTLDTFYQQPSNAGKSWVFKDRPINTTYVGIVARPVTDSDIRPQLDNANRPQTYRDGRQKYVMVVPMLMQPTAEYPDGQAGWWVKGQARDELSRAMAEAGAPAGPPEAGALIQVTLVGKRPIPGMNDAFQYRIHYQRPQGSVPAAPPEPVTPTPAPVYQQPAQQSPAYPAPMPAPVYQQPAAQFPVAAQPVQAYPMQQFAAQTAPGISVTAGPPMQQHQVVMAQTAPGVEASATQPMPQQQPRMQTAPVLSQGTPAYQGGMPAGLDPEQEALFRRLTGQPPQG